MIRSAADKVMWVGRTAVFLVGLIVILALALAVVNAVLGATGGPSLSGKFNQIDSGARWVAGEQALAVEPVARRRQIEIPRGYAQVNHANLTTFLVPGSSKGVIDIDRTSPGNVYCFNLSFTPKTAVASGHINNNATVGTVVGNDVPAECPDTHKDAAAVTYAANDTSSARRTDLSFGIVFI